jgi:hypothetical protein
MARVVSSQWWSCLTDLSIHIAEQISFLVVHLLSSQTEKSYRRHITRASARVDLQHCESTRFLRRLNEPRRTDGEGWVGWTTEELDVSM